MFNFYRKLNKLSFENGIYCYNWSEYGFCKPIGLLYGILLGEFFEKEGVHMSIKNKIISFFVAFAILVLLIVSTMLLLARSGVSDQAKTTSKTLTTEAKKEAEEDLKRLTSTIAQQVSTMEAEIDKSMLNAALTLREMDRNGEVTLSMMEKLKKETGMSDFYLTNKDGVFTVTTEKEAVGISLFNIWDGYRMLVTGESNYLPSTLKIKEETGEIFKFTAIPREMEMVFYNQPFQQNRLKKC